MRKPDAEIYDFVITENEIKPEETLFLDDRLDNLKFAEAKTRLDDERLHRCRHTARAWRVRGRVSGALGPVRDARR